jgi:NAD(P)H-dependent FMN reductase
MASLLSSVGRAGQVAAGSKPAPAMKVLGIGGTLRPGSSSEQALRIALAAAAERGAATEIFTARDLHFPTRATARSTPPPRGSSTPSAARTGSSSRRPVTTAARRAC